MTLITFATVLWGLSGSFVLPIFGGIAIPGYMMWAAILYALLGSWLTYLIGRPLVRVNFELERFNADFRYRMTRIRENAESIALYRGEADEERRLRGAFARIYATWLDFMKYTKRLTGLTAFYGQAASVFPIVVAAPHYFAGQIPLGVLTQTAGAFGEVQGSLSWFVDSYAQLAAWKATLDRLTGFRDAMAKAKTAARTEQAFDRTARPARPGARGRRRARCRTASVLIENVNLTVEQGDAVVVRGASGSGKTTLFRVLAGLWPFGRGRVGAARRRAHPLPAAEALSAARHAARGAELSGDARALHGGRLPRGAGGVRLAASGGAPRRIQQLVDDPVGRRAAAPRVRARAAVPAGLAVPRRGDLRARRGGRAAHVRAAARAPAGRHRAQHRASVECNSPAHAATGGGRQAGSAPR